MKTPLILLAFLFPFYIHAQQAFINDPYNYALEIYYNDQYTDRSLLYDSYLDRTKVTNSIANLTLWKKFINTVRNSEWSNALSFCASEIIAEARKAVSLEKYFHERFPVEWLYYPTNKKWKLKYDFVGKSIGGGFVCKWYDPKTSVKTPTFQACVIFVDKRYVVYLGRLCEEVLKKLGSE